MNTEHLAWGGDRTPDHGATDVVDPSAWDVPAMLDVLPDGRETIVVGDVQALAEGHHQQGENLRGFGGTCGICSCEGILRRFGVDVTEDQLVEHAVARGECYLGDNPAECGGTKVADQVRILRDFGIPATFERAESIEELAQHVEHGLGVIIGANAGVLWDDATYYGDGGANHAVVVTGVARDPGTGEIQGVYINDSGDGAAARLVDVADLAWGWLDAGGSCVVTDIAAPAPAERS